MCLSRKQSNGVQRLGQKKKQKRQSQKTSTKEQLQRARKSEKKARSLFRDMQIRKKESSGSYSLLEDSNRKPFRENQLIAVSTNWYELDDARPGLNDKESVVTWFLTCTHPLAFQFASPRLKDDEDFVREATFRFGKTIIAFASERLKEKFKQYPIFIPL